MTAPRDIRFEKEIFIYATRSMTVIEGIPFYQSSGRNSHQKDTWFPHRGIKEESGWIMKPILFSVPEDVQKFCDDNDIEDEVTLKRFGNLRTLCISAAIGTGFWQKPSGVKFKRFLKERYSKYFLDEKLVVDLTTQNSEPLKDILGKKKTNKRLRKLNTLIPVNESSSRLPYASEVDYFPSQASENMCEAIACLITQPEPISANTIRSLAVLSPNQAIFSYVLKHYMLEDQNQIEEINKLIAAKGEDLRLEDIVAIDQLKTSTLEFSEYKDLCDDIEFRKLIRSLNQSENKLDTADVRLINAMLDKNMKSYYIKKIMTDVSARDLLKKYLAEKEYAIEDIVRFVSELYDNEAIQTYEKVIKECESNYFGKMIFKKYSQSVKLTPQALTLIQYFFQNDLIGLVHNLFNRFVNKAKIEMMFKLFENGQLTPSVLKLIAQLEKDQLLTKGLDLFSYSTAREILFEKITTDKDNDNATLINILKKMIKGNILYSFKEMFDGETYYALKVLYNNTYLNRKGILLVKVLQENAALNELNDLLSDEDFFEKLIEVSSANDDETIAAIRFLYKLYEPEASSSSEETESVYKSEEERFIADDDIEDEEIFVADDDIDIEELELPVDESKEGNNLNSKYNSSTFFKNKPEEKEVVKESRKEFKH